MMHGTMNVKTVNLFKTFDFCSLKWYYHTLNHKNVVSHGSKCKGYGHKGSDWFCGTDYHHYRGLR
jgi:hypothetical protein